MDPNYNAMSRDAGVLLTEMMLAKTEQINKILDDEKTISIACTVKIDARGFPSHMDVKIKYQTVDGDARQADYSDPNQTTFDTVLNPEGGERQEEFPGGPPNDDGAEVPDDDGDEQPPEESQAQPDVGAPEPFELGADAPPAEQPGEAEAPQENPPEVTAELAYTNQDAGIEPKKRGRKSKKA